MDKIRETYFLSKYSSDVEVSVQKGEYRMIYNISVNIIDESGNKIERKYQFK